MEKETLPEGYFEALDINGNGLIKIGENTYKSTRTGNIYFYDGKRLLLTEEIKHWDNYLDYVESLPIVELTEEMKKDIEERLGIAYNPINLDSVASNT